MTTLTACGGGGGGLALVAGGVGGGVGGGGGLLGGMLLKGPIVDALVFQDLDGSGTFDFTDADGDGVFDPAVDTALEPYAYSDATGAFSLQTANETAPILTSGGIDTTTGAAAGQFRFGPDDNLDTVTPVSAVMSRVNADVAADQVFAKLSEAGIAVDLKNYNPISSAADAGGADATAAAVDALGAQMQATINALGAMLEGVSDINSADPHSDAVDAMVAAINSAGAAGTSIDFGSVVDVTSILNQSALGSGDYAAAVASVSQALAEVNKQLYELFTEEGGNFLDADARGMALMAQTDLIDAISEFAATPSEDAGGSLEARFDLVDDAGNPTALFDSYKAEFKDKVPEFDPVSGAPNLLASTDSLSLQKGATSGNLDPLANDVSISGFADSQLTVLGVATTRKGEPTNVTAQSLDDILTAPSDHGLTSGELISVDTGGGAYADKYAGVIDSNNFVIFDTKAAAQSFSIDSAVAVTNTAAEVLTVDGASFDGGTNLFAKAGHGFSGGEAVTLLVEGADGSLASAGEFTVDMSGGDIDNFGLSVGLSGDALPDLADAAAVGFIAKTGLGALSGLDAGAVLYFDQAHGLADGDTVTILDGAGPFTPGSEQAITLVSGSADLFQIAGIDAGSVPAATLNYIGLTGIDHLVSIADGELFFVKAAHGFATGANITALTGSAGSYGVGSGYSVTADPQNTSLFKLDGVTAANFTANDVTFVATDGLYQTAGAATDVTFYNWLSDGASISQNNVSLTINSDGTVAASVAANASAGTQTFFYKAFDPDGNVAIGPISVNVEPTKPTLVVAGVPTAIFEDVTDADLANPGVRSDASGDYLEIPIGSYFDTISLGGADPAGMSVMFTVMGLDDDAMRVVSGQSKNMGLAYRGTDGALSPSFRTDSDGAVTSNDRYITIDDAGDLAKVQSGLVLRLSEDFAGAVDLDVYMTVTEGNRFASSKAEISFSVVARADIPTLSILDKAPDADSTAAEDTAVRLFKAENGDAILTAALTDTDGSETLSLVVEKQVTLADGSKVDGTFVNAATGQAMGVERVYTIDGTSTTVIEFTEAQFDNIAVLLPENYAGTADVVARARAVEGNNDNAFSAPLTINLETTPVADPVSVSLSTPAGGVEDTPFYVNFTATQGEADEDLSVFVGDFERLLADGVTWQAVDLADIGGASGFRPNVDFVTPFAEQTVDGDTAGYYQFSESAATTAFLNAGQIEFLPLADFNGSLRYKVFARSIETDGQMSESAVVMATQTFEARSEDPNVELGGNLTAAEYQGQGVTNYTSQKLGIGELQVDQADSLELMKATVTFTDADGNALVSKGNYVTLDETGVADMKASGAVEINMTSPGTYEVIGRPADGVNAAVNLQSAMAKIGVLPPQDYSSSTSANSDITVGIQIQAKEVGANLSAPDGGSFTLSVTPVAGTPSVASSAGGKRAGSEDQLAEIGNGLTFSTDDVDGSEAIVAVTISNVPDGFVVVDSSNAAIGVSDGAGSVTLTNLTATNADGTEYGFSSQVFLRAPANFNGDLPDGALQVKAVAKEDGSGASATSSAIELGVTFSAVADAPAVSVPSSDAINPIRIGENTGGDYSAIRLNASVVERNTSTEAGYAEDLSILIRLPQSDGGAQATVTLGGSHVASTYLVASGDPDYVVGSDTYRIDEANKAALQGATFKPPVGFAGENYNVTVIGRSTDGSDVASTTKTIIYYVAPVAKAPTITTADGTVLAEGDRFDFGDVDKGDSTTPNYFEFQLSVSPVGDEQVSLILTGLPTGEYLSFANASGDAIGARNIDGTVYVVSLSEVDLNGNGAIDASEYMRMTVADTAGNSISGGVNTGNTREGSGNPIWSKDITIDLTGFALDQVGGTTAQVRVSGDGDLYYTPGGDPLVVDLAGDGLTAADFAKGAGNFDVNLDGFVDDVYMPVGSGAGLLVFDAAGDSFASVSGLSFKDHIFSEYFEFGGQYAGSSLEAISFLDSDGDGDVDGDDDRFGDIYVWTDLNSDGVLSSNEIGQTVTSVDLTGISSTGISQTAGSAATVLRTASMQVAGQNKTLYEVALGHDLNTSSYTTDFSAETISINGGNLTLAALTEGLDATDRSVSFPIVFNVDGTLPNGAVTLATVRGLPDQLSFNTGAKLDNGDWLFIKSDLVDDGGAAKDVQLIANDENYSGDFVLSYWTVTSNPLTGDTAISGIEKAVGSVTPVADSANLFVVDEVFGVEDSGRGGDGTVNTTESDPIPLNIFYALNDTDGSESAKLQLKIKASDIIHSDNNAALDLKLRYQEGGVTKELAYASGPDGDGKYTFEIDNLALVDDERILSLELIPMADYATASGSTLDIDAAIITTDGASALTQTAGPIRITVEDVADAVPIEFASATKQTDSAASPTYQYDSSATGAASVTSYEGIAAETGITLITSASGVYDILQNADTGAGLAIGDVQGLVLTITSTDPRVSEFTMVTSGGDSILPSNGGATYQFAVPSLSADDSLRLVTPENYDGNFAVEIKSLVTVNGNSALSSPITMNVDVFSDGTPAEVRFSAAEAFEDGPAFRLPVSVTLTDKSESLTNIELTTDKASGPVILTRLGNTDLNGYKTAISDVGNLTTSFDQPDPTLEGGPTLILRYASNFRASIADTPLTDQIKAVITANADPVQGLASIQTLLESLDLQQGRDWNLYVSGEVTENGVAETRYEQVELVSGTLTAVTGSGLDRAEFAETNIASEHITQSGNTFDIQFVDQSGDGAVLDLMPAKPGAAETEALAAWNSQFQLAQTWLAGRLGLTPNAGVDASFDVDVKVFTQDLDNVDAAKGSSVFSTRDTTASSHENPGNQNEDGSAKVLSVTLQATNDLPVVSNISQAASYHQGGDHILIASEALISDIDTTAFSGGAVKAVLGTPVAGENLLFVGGVSGGAAVTLDGNNIIDGASKIVGQISYITSGDDAVAVNISLTEEAGINDVQAILRGLAYRFDADDTTPFQTGTSAFTISVQDGAGVDVNGNIATTESGAVVRTAQEANIAFAEGSSSAAGEAAAVQAGLFGVIDLDGSGTPTTVFVEVTDYRSGDLLSLDASVTGVSASYAVSGDPLVGRLTLTLDATPASPAAAQALFEKALNNLHYSSSSDNPDQRLTDADHTVDAQREIVIKVQDNPSTTDVTEARTAARIAVDITAVDDAPVLNITHFEAVATSITSEAAGVARTQILQGVDAFGTTKYGTIFDPDSLIKGITVDLSHASGVTSQVDLARLQDRLSLDATAAGETTGFTVTSGAESSTLTLGLADSVLATQTLAENKAQVEAALRSIYFENNSTLLDMVTGDRNVTISFIDDADAVYVVHDASDAKLLVGSGEVGNVLPVISGVTQAASFHEGADHVLLAADALVTDGNGADFAGGLIKIDLKAPAAGDNLVLIDNAMVKVINETAGGGRIVSASSPSTVLANFTKAISDAGDITGLSINMVVPANVADAVTATQFQAILRAVGYTFDDANGASYATGNIAFDVVVQDGDGVDASGQINSFASGSVAKTAQESAVTFTEGDAVAQAETGANEVGLFGAVNLTGSGAPASIEVVVSDFRAGDILRTTSSDVGSSYDASTGVLTLTSPSGGTPAEQLASFQSALNALVYSNSSDNPLQAFTDADHTTDPQRLIEIRVADNASTGDVNEARTVAKISVDITATDDAADLQINDFERVQIAALDPDTGLPSAELSVQPTQLMPASLFDQPGTDAIASTIHGGTFDPDTLISKIRIDVTSVDASLVGAALQQDKLFFDAGRAGETTSFAVSAGDETASLTLTLDVAGQTLAENQVQVEAALRSVHFKNYEPLAELVSGYRDVKITFNDDATAVYDSSLDQQLAKLLVGKALQPGDTHVGLNMAISADRLTSSEAIAEVIFTIETDSGTADLNDRLYILNDAGLIVEELEAGDLIGGKATFIWHPPANLVLFGNTNGGIVSILKDQIGFGGQSIDQGGLRTIAVDIYDASHTAMGPAGLKATVFVQPDENDFVSAVTGGVVTNVADTDAGDGDIASFDGYTADRPLTIDLSLQRAIITNDDQTATVTDVAGFEKVVGSSRDDLIIAGGSGTSNIAGGQGDDTIAGGADDVADYGLEEVFGEHKPNYEASGIIADLQTGEVTDSYGDTDIIYRNENGVGIQNIVATSKDDIIIGSDQDNVIKAGSGDDLILAGAGDDEVFGGLGDDRIIVGSGDDTLYGDSGHEAGGRDTFVFEGGFGTDRIEDFEAAAARPANYNLADTVWGPSLGGDRIIVRLDQDDRLEAPVAESGKIVLRKTRQDGQTHSVLVNNAAGLVTATTIALVTSEVMAVGDLSGLNSLAASISLSREDVLDLSALTGDLVIDQGFSRIWEASNPNGMIDVQGYEQIVGGAGDDVLIAAGGEPFGLAGGAGHDQLYGGPDDILRYDMEEAYRSAVQATGVSVDLEAGTATDTFGDTDTLNGFDNVIGTAQDDVILGDSGNNRIHGHDGNDLLDGRAGDDIIIGGHGQDIIIGGTGNDVLTGDGGNGQFADIFDFRGDAGSLSDFGHDVVTDFQTGLDTARFFLNGTSTMTAGASSASAMTINAGAGSVQFNWDETIEAGISFAQLMNSVEEIRFLDTLVDIDASMAPQGKLESILQLSGIDVGAGNGLFVDVAFQQIWDPDGALLDLDEFYEAAGFDTYLGSMGDDIIVGAAETGVGLAGGKGADFIVGSSLDTLRFDIEEEMETEALLGEALNRHHNHVEVNLGDGHIGLADLMIDGSSVADAEIAAGSATDLWGDQDTVIGVENVVGSSGDDLLFGSAEENSIAGGAGDDLIYGGAGSDVLEGGYGADTFIYLSRDNAQSRDDIDTILDFDVSQDKLTFEGLGIEDMQVDVVDLDNSGKLDVMFTAVDAPDWGAVVLVDVGRLDAEEIVVSSEVVAV